MEARANMIDLRKCFHCGKLGNFKAQCPQKKVELDLAAKVLKVLQKLLRRQEISRVSVKEPAENPDKVKSFKS